MKYLLSEEEYEELKGDAVHTAELSVSLQLACIQAAIRQVRTVDSMEIVGCLMESSCPSVSCCDGCPVIDLCPYDGKVFRYKPAEGEVKDGHSNG